MKLPKNLKKLQEQGILSGIIALIVSLLVLWLALTQKSLLLRFSSLGYLGLFISNFLASTTLFIPIPSLVTSFFSGEVLNPVLIGLFAGAGSALGDFVAFLLGFGTRRVINGFLKKEHFFGKWEFWFKRNAFVTIFVLAFIPNPFFDGVGLLAGAFNVRPRDFLLATVLGRVLRNILLALGGHKILS